MEVKRTELKTVIHEASGDRREAPPPLLSPSPSRRVILCSRDKFDRGLPVKMLLYVHALDFSFSIKYIDTQRNTQNQEIGMVSTSIQNKHLHELETEQKP